jgi:hypothetical protein
MKTTLITLTVLSSLTAGALANPSTDPKLPKEVQAMHCLVGNWVSKTAQFNLDGKKRKGEIAINCTAASGGFAISCTSKLTIEGLGAAQETDLFGYDPQAKLYHWYAVTSMGDSHDHVSLPPTGPDQPIVFAHSGFENGKPMQEVLRMAFNADATKIEFRNDNVVAGQSAGTIVATLVKK